MDGVTPLYDPSLFLISERRRTALLCFRCSSGCRTRAILRQSEEKKRKGITLLGLKRSIQILVLSRALEMRPLIPLSGSPPHCNGCPILFLFFRSFFSVRAPA